MYKVAKLKEEERRILFRNTAQKMGIHEAIVKKTFGFVLDKNSITIKQCMNKHINKEIGR